MKKILTVGLTFLLTICLSASFLGCNPVSYYCNPQGKQWYNEDSLPTLTDPYNEVYDGCYRIEIDQRGNVAFTPWDGVTVKGTLVSESNMNRRQTDISISFENGTSATGYCYKKDKERTLVVYYEKETYVFKGERQLSKEEFEEYRNQLIEFLTGVYQTGVFPTEEEIGNDNFYRNILDYHQIDPCCGGPIVYNVAIRASIAEIVDTDQDQKISVTFGPNTADAYFSDLTVSAIKNGEIKPLTADDFTAEDCLIVTRNFPSTSTFGTAYSISGIFVIESDS